MNHRLVEEFYFDVIKEFRFNQKISAHFLLAMEDLRQRLILLEKSAFTGYLYETIPLGEGSKIQFLY